MRTGTFSTTEISYKNGRQPGLFIAIEMERIHPDKTTGNIQLLESVAHQNVPLQDPLLETDRIMHGISIEIETRRRDSFRAYALTIDPETILKRS